MDDDGFQINQHNGKEVRSNFWNKINPKITSILEQVDGFSTAVDEWYYYVREMKSESEYGDSYFVVFKNPNYKAYFHPNKKETPDQSQSQSQSQSQIKHDQTKHDTNIIPQEALEKIGRAELPQKHGLDCINEPSAIIPLSIFEEYVSIIIFKKNTNIQIPSMYDLIKTIDSKISIVGIKKSKFETITVRDVFGVA